MEVAREMKMGYEYVHNLCCNYLTDGEAVIYGGGIQGKGVELYNNQKHKKISNDIAKELVKYIDVLHSDGENCWNQEFGETRLPHSTRY